MPENVPLVLGRDGSGLQPLLGLLAWMGEAWVVSGSARVAGPSPPPAPPPPAWLTLLSPGRQHPVCRSARCRMGNGPGGGRGRGHLDLEDPGQGQRLSLSLAGSSGPLTRHVVPYWSPALYRDAAPSPGDRQGQPCPSRRLSSIPTGSRWSKLTGGPWSHHRSLAITAPLAASA